ncbi:MAG: ParA family protein [Clostridiales bacterium]|jgi:chromosome partitioning protein|nr:ParA family protein [Clostridiales bacterium]
MGKVIAVANQKGGVGKTTTCVNLCCALKEAGRKVLLCDIDPQGNSTSGMGIDKKTVSPSLYNVLVDGVKAEKAVIKTKFGDALPSNAILSGAGIELVSTQSREFVLKKALDDIKNNYEFIFIDCPPSLEMLTLNALCASDSVLIPVQCEYFALEGLTDLITTIRMTKKALNPSLEIEGVLLTMFDSRTNFSMQVAEEVKKFFKTKVYNVVIPRNVRISEAPSHGLPVLVYDRGSRGAQTYIELAKEFIRRNRDPAGNADKNG